MNSTIEKYDKIRQDVAWGSGEDSDVTKKRLMDTYSIEDLAEVEDFARGLSSKIEDAVSAYEEKACRYLSVGSDDGYYDLRCHIASEGVEEAMKYVDDPTLLEERAEKYDYEENFFYVFPDAGDYDMLNIGYYKKHANRMKEELGEPSTVDEHDALCVVEEIEQGIFNPSHDYTKLSKLGLGYYLPNIWKNGLRFYKKES